MRERLKIFFREGRERRKKNAKRTFIFVVIAALRWQPPTINFVFLRALCVLRGKK
jgi:hypothetical protein